MGNDANILKLTMPEHASGDGATFTIEGQDAGGSNKDGGDISIVGGAKTGTGDVGNILLQGGYTSTGVTINPAGNIETKGTLTVDSNLNVGGDCDVTGTLTASTIAGTAVPAPLATTSFALTTTMTSDLVLNNVNLIKNVNQAHTYICLLYTSDAADE